MKYLAIGAAVLAVLGVVGFLVFRKKADAAATTVPGAKSAAWLKAHDLPAGWTGGQTA